jgi:glycosyltransferase involved in cell wall biosynthesis
MKKELSILLITYNRKKRLEKTFPKIISNKSDKIEFVVIDNNSTDDTETYIKEHSEVDSRIRYFKNFRNLGPNRTLYRGILESEANWVTIVTDDDLFPKEFFDEILAEIDKGCNCGLIIPAKKNQKPLYDKTTILNGIHALKAAYLHTSAIPGITWNKDYIEEPKWLLDGYIYTQVRISSNISLKSDVMYLVPKHMLEVLSWDEDKLFSLPRPKDFGVFELIDLLDEIKKRNNLGKFYYEAIASRFIWTSNLFKNLFNEDKSKSIQFFDNLLTHKSIRSSVIFWIIFIKYQHKSIKSLRLTLYLISRAFLGLIISVFNKNLYQTIFFILVNINEYKNKSIF